MPVEARCMQLTSYLEQIKLLATMSGSGSKKLPIPELPEPAHAELDSMLARKFGKEVANYFSG